MGKKRLLLLGGGHAHMVTLANIRNFVNKGCDVTVIQPSEYHYYSGMGPGMLGGTYQPDDIRFATRKMVERQGGIFVLAKAAAIDPDKQVVRLAHSGQEVEYDVLSCNVGSFVPKDLVRTDSVEIFTVKPIESLLHARQKILAMSKERPLQLAVIGGGPSSIEIAGNLQQLCQRQSVYPPRISIYAGRQLMAGKPSKIRELALASLTRRGVQIMEGARVHKITKAGVILEDGTSHPADIIFPAVGVQPPPIFAYSGLPVGPDGGLLVNRFLQCSAYPNIFGGGDCIYFEPQPLDKVGVYAVRENPVLHHNLMARLSGGALKPFKPGGSYLLIYNLGNNEGIFCKWFIIFSGRLAFRMKDSIDRKFIDTFRMVEN